MFHYHFTTRAAFLRALLQGIYEEMFSQLTFEGAREWGPVENLRAALRFLGRFLRANRPILARVLADALTGNPIAREYLRDNFPRHLGVMQALIVQGQEAGLIRPLPVAQALGFCAGSLAAPIIFGGAVAESGNLGRAGSKMIQDTLLSDTAIDERIELALSAITLAAAAPKARRAPDMRGRK